VPSSSPVHGLEYRLSEPARRVGRWTSQLAGEVTGVIPVARRLTPIIALGAVALGGCGGGSGQSSLVRLGCHQYCLNAGGYGGGGPPRRSMTKMLRTRVVVQADGTVPIEIECLFRLPCMGVIALSSASNSSQLLFACNTRAVPGSRISWWAQSDLELPAHSTRTFGLTLSECAHRLLLGHRRLEVLVTVDSGLTFLKVPRGEQEQFDSLGGGNITLYAP